LPRDRKAGQGPKSGTGSITVALVRNCLPSGYGLRNRETMSEVESGGAAARRVRPGLRSLKL
jgi:hypothetical protein